MAETPVQTAIRRTYRRGASYGIALAMRHGVSAGSLHDLVDEIARGGNPYGPDTAYIDTESGNDRDEENQ